MHTPISSEKPIAPEQVLVDLAALIASMEQVDESEALGKALAFVLDFFGGCFAVFNRFDLPRGQIVTEHGYRLPESYQHSAPLAGRICYEELIVARKPHAFLSDLSHTDYVSTDPNVSRFGLRAYAGTVVRLPGRLIGSLVVYDHRPRAFDESGRMVLSIVSHWLAGIYARRLLERRLAQKAVNEKMLSSISAKAISTPDDAFVEFCLQTIGQTLGLDLACLQWYDLENQRFDAGLFHWEPHSASSEKVAVPPLCPIDLPPIREVLVRREPYCCSDSDTIDDAAMRTHPLWLKFKSFALVPICKREKTCGLFTMAIKNERRDWAEEELDTLMTIMGIIAQWKEACAIARQLDESQALNEQLYQLSPAAIYRIDLRNLRLLKVNAESCRYTGYTEEELMAMPADQLLTPSSREAFYSQLADIAAGKPVPEDLEVEFTTKRGSTEWGLLHIRHLYENGEVWGANVVAHLITEQKKAREELDGYRRRLETLVEERTRELSLANQKLREEIARRAEATKELHMKSERLTELNTAMRVLLDKRNEDRLRAEENIRVNLVQLIEPYLDRMGHSGLNEAQQQLLNVIRMNLNEVVGPPMPELSAKYYIFSPGELQVANLIRKGRTTKDMARLLNISPRTVESYRNNIRKKLGLKSKKVNLKTYLSSKE